MTACQSSPPLMNVMVLTGTWFCMGSKAGFRGFGFAGECLRRLRNKILWLGASECFLSTFDYLGPHCGLECNVFVLQPVSVSRCIQSLGRDPEAQQTQKNRICKSMHPELQRGFKMQRMPSKSVSASRCIQNFGFTRSKAKVEGAVPLRYHQLDHFRIPVLAGPAHGQLIYGWESRYGVLDLWLESEIASFPKQHGVDVSLQSLPPKAWMALLADRPLHTRTRQQTRLQDASSV